MSHNSVESLLTCLQSLLRETRDVDCEIWVVDNLCEERAASAVRQRFPSVNVIENDATLGLSANHNQVLRRCAHDADFVLLLNPDVELYPQSVARLLAVMATDPEAAACGPQLVDCRGQLQPVRRHAIKPVRETLLTSAYISDVDPEWLRRLALRWRRRNSAPGVEAQRELPSTSGVAVSEEPEPVPVPVAVVSGACALLRSSAIADIGLYDERFFLYLAETDWCVRALKRGWRVLHVPQVRVLHEGGVSTRRAYTRYLGIYVESAIKFYRKHRGPWIATAMGVTLSAVAGANLVRWTLQSKLGRARRTDRESWIRLSRSLPLAIWSALRPDSHAQRFDGAVQAIP